MLANQQGIDPIGRKELMNLFKKLHQDGIIIVLVTHLMDDVAEYADQVYDGKSKISQKWRTKLCFSRY